MKNKLFFVLINIFLCLIITLLNQRQEFIWLFCFGYIFVCFIFFTLVNNDLLFKNSIPVKASALYVIFFIAIIANNTSNNWLKYVSLAFFPIVMFQTNFYLFKKRYLSINVFILLVLLLAVLASYKVFFVNKLLVDLNSNSLQTNWSNLLSSCLPIVFLIKKRSLQYVFLFFVGTFIIIGLKRTGLISLFTTLFIFVFFRVQQGKVVFSLKWAVLTLFVLGSGFVLFLQDKSSESLDKAMLRIERLSEDGGSGRDNIYIVGFNNWIDNSYVPLENKIIGSGYYGFRRKSGISSYEAAHNDILDFAYDYGIFAVLCLLLFYFRLFKILIMLWRKKNKHFQFVLSTVLIFLIYSVFSGFYHFFFFFIPLILSFSLIEVIVNDDFGKSCSIYKTQRNRNDD